MTYLIDTNILIYYFNGLVRDDRIDKILETSFNILIITKIEFLSWSRLNDDVELDKKAKALVNHMSVVTNNCVDFEVLGLDVIGINVKL